MRSFYLIAAVVGAVVPYLFMFTFIAESGVDLTGFVAALFVNGASGMFTADLLISSFVFWGFMLTRPSGPRPWVFIALNLLVGLSCAFPAYLYAAEAPE